MVSAKPYGQLRYREIAGKQMAYVDESNGAAGTTIVFQHGNPTSSYLWRNVIPHMVDRARCLAPDLVGMGSSGPAPDGRYRFVDHARYLDAWFDAVVPDEPVVLVLHDWGSALGFHWAFRHQTRVKAIAYMEAIIQPREWQDLPDGRRDLFRRLRSAEGERLVFEENFFVETLLPRLIIRPLDKKEMKAYRAPFLEPSSRLPTLVWPRELPIAGEPSDVVEIVERYAGWLDHSPVPKLLIKAEPGSLIVGPTYERCRRWPDQQEVAVEGIHFLQEDSPDEIGAALRRFVGEVAPATSPAAEGG